MEQSAVSANVKLSPCIYRTLTAVKPKKKFLTHLRRKLGIAFTIIAQSKWIFEPHMYIFVMRPWNWDRHRFTKKTWHSLHNHYTIQLDLQRELLGKTSRINYAIKLNWCKVHILWRILGTQDQFELAEERRGSQIATESLRGWAHSIREGHFLLSMWNDISVK